MSVKLLLMDMIDITDLSKFYGNNIIINNIFLECLENKSKFIQDLFMKKLSERHCKLILEYNKEDYDNKNNLKESIKNIINYGFDGFLFKITNNTNMKSISKLSKTLCLLPSPYNFKWSIFLQLDNVDSDLFEIKDMINKYKEVLNIYVISKNSDHLLKSGIDNSNIVKLIETINELYCEDTNIKNIYSKCDINNIRFSIENSELNNIEYPSSTILYDIHHNLEKSNCN